MYESWLTARDSEVPLAFEKQDTVPSLSPELVMSDRAVPDNISPEDELLTRISERIAAFALLYDIPFCYLLPGEELLPSNSLRFFYLDPNWIFSLMDGALSPGRTAGIDVRHDQELAADAYARAMRESEKIRRVLQGKPPLEPLQAFEHQGNFEPLVCTGFLMRSPLVTGWRGLEFTAYDAGKNPLRALRIETFSHDVLLALFLGEIDHFTLREPPEGLHYGMEMSEGKLSAGLRSFEDGTQDGETIFDIPTRNRRVIDFAGVAANIANATKVKMDSAKIALQLIKTACTLTVKVKPEEEEK